MRHILLMLGVVALILAVFGCSKSPKPSNQETTDANTAAVTTLDSITDANQALAEGNRLLDENQTEQAIAVLEQAVQLDPDLAEAHFKLGIAYSLLELQQEQEGVVPGDVPANNKGSHVKTRAEKAFEKAVEAYKKWLDKNPKDDAAQFNLGRAYAKLTRDEDAEKAFRQAVKLKPDDSEYQTELGAILIKLAKYHEAIEPLKKAVELDDTNVRAAELLEDAEAGRNRLDYVSPQKDSNANSSKQGNSNANTSNTNSNSNSATRFPDSNVKAKPEPGKKPNPTPKKAI